MKIEKLITRLSILLLSVLSAQAQGTFQNLNFEQANPVVVVDSTYYPYAVTEASALPDWNVSIGGVPVTQVWLNSYSLGAANVDIFGPGWTALGPGIIDGNYSVYLQAFFASEGNVSLSQTGMIPANAQSLQFKAWLFPALNTTFSVSFAGNSLMPVVLSSGQTPAGQPYDVYGANIAQYAGQTGQLEFTALDTTSSCQIELDDITFSTTAVPEPGVLPLILVGGFTLALRRWRAEGS